MSHSSLEVPTPTDVVRELARRFQAGDRAGAMELLHPEFRIQQPESLPHGGWHRGMEGMDEMASIFGRHWVRTIADPRVLDCGHSAVQITTQTWTAKDTGRQASVDVVELFAIADGLITEIRVFQQDTHLLLNTLERGRVDTAPDVHLQQLAEQADGRGGIGG
jgi:hypothetical protein